MFVQNKEIKALVLDVNVPLLQVLGQNGHQKAARILYLKDQFRLSVLVPEISKYEFLNTAARLIGAKNALQAYEELIEKQVSFVPINGEIIDKALQITAKYPQASYYDASYHALAQFYDIPFVTNDQKYYQAVHRDESVKMLEDFECG